MPKTKRLFIAINLSPELKNQLADLEKEISNRFPEETATAVAKWVAPENLHLTLLFLGEVGESEIPKLPALIQAIAENYQPVVLKFKRVGYGPDKVIPPRFIWIELENNPAIAKLAGDLQEASLQAGILRFREARSFSPHITLARIKEWIWRRIERDERPEIEQELDFVLEVKSLALMESQLRRGGPEYNLVQSFPL